METFLWIVGTVVVLAFVIGIAIAVNTSKRKTAMVEHLSGLDDFSATQHVAGEDGLTGFAIDDERKKVCLIDHKQAEISTRIVSYKDLLSCEIFEDGKTVTKTSRSSQIGGALVGGLALGGVGAVIGGLSGKTTSAGKIMRVDLRLIVNDTANPLHDINFMNCESTKDGILYTQGIQQARHWHALVSVLIKMADSEDQPRDTSPEKSSAMGLLADEIRKLADLRDAGALSDVEFQRQKARLLA